MNLFTQWAKYCEKRLAQTSMGRGTLELLVERLFRPSYENQTEKILARSGLHISYSGILLTIFLIIYFLSIGQTAWVNLTITALTFLGCALAIYFINTNRLRKAIWLIVFIPFSGALLGATLNLGIDNISLHAIYPVVFIAAAYLGKRTVGWLGAITLASLITMYFLMVNGYYDQRVSPANPLSSLMVSITMVVCTIAISQFTIHQLVNSNKALTVAKEDADSANRMKSAFLANMSHELRTPLNAIIGYSEAIIEEAADEEMFSPQHLQDIERIHLAGRHLLSLVSDILDLSKIEADKTDLQLSAIQVQEFASEIKYLIYPVIQRRHNQFDISISLKDDLFVSDEAKLRQILINLLSNAAKFNEHGYVALNISELLVAGSRHLKFEVADDGIGIPEGELHRIFEAFAQVDNSYTRVHKGTGLGLTISRNLAEILGGTLEVMSRDGEGATFVLLIPHLDITNRFDRNKMGRTGSYNEFSIRNKRPKLI